MVPVADPAYETSAFVDNQWCRMGFTGGLPRFAVEITDRNQQPCSRQEQQKLGYFEEYEEHTE